MQTVAVFAAALACASSAVAQNEQYYNLVASAPGETFDGEDLKPLGRHWHIGIQANSSCGEAATPAVALIDEAIAVYNDGTSHQQYGKYTTQPRIIRPTSPVCMVPTDMSLKTKHTSIFPAQLMASWP